MWPYLIYSIACMLLLPFIEWLRYKNEYGKKANLDKWGSIAIAAVVWLLQVWAMDMFQWAVVLFAICCICIRGVFYDPALNLFLGRYIDQESRTTNSKTDQWERRKKISFWWQRALYLLAAVAFGVAYELVKLMNKV